MRPQRFILLEEAAKEWSMDQVLTWIIEGDLAAYAKLDKPFLYDGSMYPSTSKYIGPVGKYARATGRVSIKDGELLFTKLEILDDGYQSILVDQAPYINDGFFSAPLSEVRVDRYAFEPESAPEAVEVEAPSLDVSETEVAPEAVEEGLQDLTALVPESAPDVVEEGTKDLKAMEPEGLPDVVEEDQQDLTGLTEGEAMNQLKKHVRQWSDELGPEMRNNQKDRNLATKIADIYPYKLTHEGLGRLLQISSPSDKTPGALFERGRRARGKKKGKKEKEATNDPATHDV